MKIVNTFRNNLLKRNEVTALVTEQSNPGLSKASTLLASDLKISEDLIALKSVRSQFGSNEFTLSAFVYDTTADKQHTEPKVKIKQKKEGQ